MPDFKEKRFTLSSEEKNQIIRLKRIFDDLNFQQEGIMRLMDVELVKVRTRVGLIDQHAPEGIERLINFDPKTFELIVTDKPIIEMAKK